MNLDQKLRSILDSYLEGQFSSRLPSEGTTAEEAIAAIKQAVVEELPNNPGFHGDFARAGGFNSCLSEIKLKLGVKLLAVKKCITHLGY